MPTLKLTKPLIDDLKPQATDQVYWDQILRGFGVKVTPAGRKVFIDRRADKLFYFVKGQSYAYFIALRAVREDFKDVIVERRVAGLFDAMLADLATAASLQPVIVQNASPNALLMPNHLSTEGFYLLRARSKMREITDILQR